MKVHSDKKKRTIVIDDKWSESEIQAAIVHLNSVLFDIRRQSGDDVVKIRTFDVDWNNLESVDKAFLSLQGRRQQLKKSQSLLKKPTESEIYRIKWDAIQEILNKDTNFLYEERDFDTEERYYVYAHCDTSKPLSVSNKNAFHTFAATLGMKYMPFYIGKGTGSRYEKGDRNRNYTKIQNKKFTEVHKVILKDNLSEVDALDFESKLIDIFGLAIHGGHLINIDEGLQRDHRRFCYRDALNKLRNVEESL